MKGFLTVGAALAVVAGCGGGTGSSGEQTTIDLEGAERGIELVSGAIPICRTGAGLRSTVSSERIETRTAWLAKLLIQRRGNLRADWDRQSLFPPVKPSDEFGDCGGRITFPTYNHANGVTSGTLTFDNYCTLNDNTGNRNTANGSVTFVDTGTPSASGPITTEFEANSPAGITLVESTTAGATLSSSRVSFTDFLYDIGVPGGTPTAGNPDRVTLEEARITDLDLGRTYVQSNYSVTSFNTASGGQVLTMSGRSHRSNGDYSDVTTSGPITFDADGNVVSGQVTFSGAGGSNAVVTLVPGPVFQATMTVNGAPVTNVPACQ